MKNGKLEASFERFRKSFGQINLILKQNKISEKEGYKKWYRIYKSIYGASGASIRLFSIHFMIFLLSDFFIKKHGLEINGTFQEERDSIKKFFVPINQIIGENLDKDILFQLIEEVFLELTKSSLNPEFYFDYIIQNLIFEDIRHKSGEYYTPPSLVKKMVSEAYNWSEKVIDPCSGTGNFLIEIIKNIISSDIDINAKNSALNNLYGCDINPLSIYLSRISILYLLKEFSLYFPIKLFNIDSLQNFPNNLRNKFDLVIGNPPWYTYRDIENPNHQYQMKILASDLNIKPLPKNILNLEIATLFFYQANNQFLKENAKIFFVMPKGVITGSHASRFRNFFGFKELMIWSFDKQIEKLFNIDFICIYGKKTVKRDKEQYNRKEIPLYHFTWNNAVNKNQNSNEKLILKEKTSLIPYGIHEKGKKIHVKKLISKDKMEILIPNQISYYKKRFHKGADLNPRNLIFVTFQEKRDTLIKISPDSRVFKKAKKPWNIKEFEKVVIEEKYIFKVIKSTELVKFHVYDYYYVFLPLEKQNLAYKPNILMDNAKKFFGHVNKIYLNKKKSTTRHVSLMDNLNRWNKLINKGQLSDIKIAYNNSGSILNAAVIQGDFLVTGDLSYLATNSLKEAYYLSALLNSDIINEQIKIRRSSRHIFKIPFELPIKKFDPKNKNHQILANLGMKGEEIARNLIVKYKEKNENKISKRQIQMILKRELIHLISKLDNHVLREFE